jgi:adenosylmethionine-8-amino-7-oxononanoate aminotransferase
VGVLLIEMFTSNTLMGFSYAYLLALRYITAVKGVLLAVDDVMMGLRTGRVFSYLHYPAFYPDLVTFGKGFQISGVASVTPPPDAPTYIHHISSSPNRPGVDLGGLGGRVTTGGADRPAMERAVALLWEWDSQKLGQNSTALGSALLEQASALFVAKGITRYIRGIGAIFSSDATFGGVLRQNLLHARVLMRLDISPSLVREVFRVVLNRREPEAACALQEPALQLTSNRTLASKESAVQSAVERHLAETEQALVADIRRLEESLLHIQHRRSQIGTARKVRPPTPES